MSAKALDILQVSGCRLAQLELEAGATGATVRAALASYTPEHTELVLLTVAGSVFDDDEPIEQLAGAPLQAVIKQVKQVFEHCGGGGNIDEEGTLATFNTSSGGAIVRRPMTHKSGLFHFHLRVTKSRGLAEGESRDLETGLYVSLGLVSPGNRLDCGPGFVENEIAWLMRSGNASFLQNWDQDGQPCSLEGEPAEIQAEDDLELLCDTDAGQLTCRNATRETTFKITGIPEDAWPLCFAAGGHRVHVRLT